MHEYNIGCIPSQLLMFSYQVLSTVVDSPIRTADRFPYIRLGGYIVHGPNYSFYSYSVGLKGCLLRRTRSTSGRSSGIPLMRAFVGSKPLPDRFTSLLVLYLPAMSAGGGLPSTLYSSLYHHRSRGWS